MQWFNIVKWVLFALVNAEEVGVTSKNIDEALKSENPDIRRLVGTEGDYGRRMGLTKYWAANAIRLVGNYGEVYERTVVSAPRLAFRAGSINCGAKGEFSMPLRSVENRHANMVPSLIASARLTPPPLSALELGCNRSV